MSGYGDGIFAPGAGLTRAQTAQMLFNLLTGTCEITASFADVDSNFWCYKAIGTLASLGVIQGNNGYFRPDASVSRAEFLAMVSRFYEMPEPGEDAYAFSDVSKDHWAYRYIQNGTAKGWVNGYSNGTFAPDAPVSRAEAAVIINRVLGRNADRQLINANPNLCKFYDIAPSHWAYYEIMEATVSHVEQITFGGETWASYDDAGIELSTGFHYIENHLYYYDSEGGGFVRDGNVGRFDFNSDGRYTTGSEELDTYLYDVSCQIFKDSMSKEERLRAAYLYTRDSFTYLRRNYYDNGATGWETAEALTMFRTHHGNCYCYASVFYFLSRWIGYDSTIFAGQVGVNRSPHGWVEIMLDGTVYMFDAELEMARLRDHRPYYDLYKFTYSNAPWSYYK